MLVLGIESSCDETACAVVRDGSCLLYTSKGEAEEDPGGDAEFPAGQAAEEVEEQKDRLPHKEEVVEHLSLIHISKGRAPRVRLGRR